MIKQTTRSLFSSRINGDHTVNPSIKFLRRFFQKATKLSYLPYPLIKILFSVIESEYCGEVLKLAVGDAVLDACVYGDHIKFSRFFNGSDFHAQAKARARDKKAPFTPLQFQALQTSPPYLQLVQPYNAQWLFLISPGPHRS